MFIPIQNLDHPIHTLNLQKGKCNSWNVNLPCVIFFCILNDMTKSPPNVISLLDSRNLNMHYFSSDIFRGK